MAIQVFTNGGVLSSAASAFSYNAVAPLTLMVWLKANDSNVWAQRTSMAGVYGPASPTTAIQIGCYSSGIVGAWTYGGSQLVNTVGYTPLVGEWAHFTISYDGVSTFNIFVNGVLNNTRTFNQQAGNLSQTFINGYPGGSAGAESGNFSVDDFICFNRQLSTSEIHTIFNIKGPRDNITNGLICRYTFDEGYIGGNVSSIKDISASPQVAMTSTTAIPVPIYTTPIAMCNLRRPQG